MSGYRVLVSWAEESNGAIVVTERVLSPHDDYSAALNAMGEFLNDWHAEPNKRQIPVAVRIDGDLLAAMKQG